MYYSRKQATQADIDNYRDKAREEFAGKGFKIESNGYGLRVECDTCHDSATLNPEMYMRNHSHSVAPVADFREETVNPDGTKNTILYYGAK